MAQASHKRIHREARKPALEHLVWLDRVAEALSVAVAEPANLMLACLLMQGLSLLETAAGLGISQKTVYGRPERWRRRIGEAQSELDASRSRSRGRLRRLRTLPFPARHPNGCPERERHGPAWI